MSTPTKNKINFGIDWYKQEKDKKRPTNFQYGAVDKQVLMPERDWTYLQPECEIQKTEKVDLMNCVTQASINAISLILQKKFGIKENWSQRFTAKMSGTTTRGNSLYAVANSIRNDGIVLEVDWSYNKMMSWMQYYAEPYYAVKQKGKKFILEFDVSYEFIPTNKDTLKDALQYACPVVIGYAWAKEGEVYKDYGYRPNHAFIIGRILSDGKYIAIDSYPTDFIIDENSDKQEFFKTLASGFQFGDALLYTVNLKATDRRSWLYKIIDMLKNLKWNFWVDKDDPTKGTANGEIYMVKNGNKKKVDDINDVMAVLEMNFGIEKTDWGELGKYPEVTKFPN